MKCKKNSARPGKDSAYRASAGTCIWGTPPPPPPPSPRASSSCAAGAASSRASTSRAPRHHPPEAEPLAADRSRPVRPRPVPRRGPHLLRKLHLSPGGMRRRKKIYVGAWGPPLPAAAAAFPPPLPLRVLPVDDPSAPSPGAFFLAVVLAGALLVAPDVKHFTSHAMGWHGSRANMVRGFIRAENVRTFWASTSLLGRRRRRLWERRCVCEPGVISR